MSGPWMLTASGKDHYLDGCGAMMNHVDIHDVAHHLAQLNRFTGACVRPESVAEHSILAADLAAHDGHGPYLQLLLLTHDGHEAYTGDASSPAKLAIGAGWTYFERLHADRVRRALGLITGFATHRKLVTHYDNVALATERRDLTTYDAAVNEPWPVLDTPGNEVKPSDRVRLNTPERAATSWWQWRDEFLTRYFDLQRQVRAQASGLMTPLDNTV